MSQPVIAVDIGASAIHAVRLELSQGQLELTGAAATELNSFSARPAPEPVAASEDALSAAPEAAPNDPGSDMEAAPARDAGNGRAPGRVSGRADAEPDPERERELRASLTSLIRKSGLRSNRSVLGLGGATALIRYLQVPPVPPWKLDLMMKYEVQEQGASAEPSAFDYRILDLPDVGGQLTVMLAQVQEKRLLTRTETARRAGLPRPDVDLNALGLFNAYLYGHGADAGRTTVLVDIGAQTVNLVVVNGLSLYFARSVPGGGARLTAAVAEGLRLSPEEAEALKRGRGRILPPDQADDPELSDAEKRLSATLEREVGAIAGLIDASLMYCRAQTKQAKLRPDEILLSGGGSMLPGLPEVLARRLRVRVLRLEPFRKISLGAMGGRHVEEISAEAPRYAVAVGLAASRLVPAAVRFSMVSEAVKARRRFLESGVYMWYAAASFLLVVGLLAWTPLRNKNLSAAELTARKQLLEGAAKKHGEFDQLYAEVIQRHAEDEALEERVYSGEDIVKVLGLLRKRTWGSGTGAEFKNIVILEAGNDPPQALTAESEEYRGQTGQTFQKNRHVFIRGLATAPITGTPTEAEEQVKKLIDRYKKELLLRRDDGANDIIQEIFLPRSQPVAQELGGRQVGVQFVMELILCPPKSRLAAPGGGP